MGRRAHHRFGIRDGRPGIDQFRRAQRPSTAFTLVAIGFFIATTRTLTLDEAVSQKETSLGIEKLFVALLDERPLGIEDIEKLLADLTVLGAGRLSVIVKADSDSVEGRFNLLVVAIGNNLRVNPFGPREEHDRNPVLIGTADIDNVSLSHPLVPNVDIPGR